MIVIGDRAVDPNLCNHNGPPDNPNMGNCHCIHDWRIFWGNPPKHPKAQSTMHTPSF